MKKNRFNENEIDNVMINLQRYINPEYFKPSLDSQLKKGPRFDKKMVEKYWQILTAIDWFTKKIGKYEIFFEFFYPRSKKITEYEALEHHVYAYLEDLETLKNKLTVFVGNLKNDIKKIAINQGDVDQAFKAMVNNIIKVFGASKIRGDHRHGQYKFVDPYSTDNQLAYTILSQKELKDRLTEKGLQEVEKMKKESFIKGKKWWSQNAQNNYEQVDGLVNEVVKINKEYLYKLLDIKPIIVKKKFTQRVP